MNADAVIESFRLAREAHPDGPALFHSRFTTGGVVDETNCHPFRVCGDGRTILAHNGVLPLDVPEGDDRSDTRYFAEEFGPMLYPGVSGGFNLNSKRGRRRLRDWLGNPNKFVILTIDPTFKRYSFILNEDQGIWEDDRCWYSNGGYKQRTYGIGTYYGGYGGSYSRSDDWDRWDDKPAGDSVWTRLAKSTDGKTFHDKGAGAPDGDRNENECVICDARGTVHPELNYCYACGSCNDCFGDALTVYQEGSCECAWPTGTNPALTRMWGAEQPSGTGWPTDVGPRSITAAPDVAAYSEGVDQ